MYVENDGSKLGVRQVNTTIRILEPVRNLKKSSFNLLCFLAVGFDKRISLFI
jgi:hypothetical protein